MSLRNKKLFNSRTKRYDRPKLVSNTHKHLSLAPSLIAHLKIMIIICYIFFWNSCIMKARNFHKNCCEIRGNHTLLYFMRSDHERRC